MDCIEYPKISDEVSILRSSSMILANLKLNSKFKEIIDLFEFND